MLTANCSHTHLYLGPEHFQELPALRTGEQAANALQQGAPASIMISTTLLCDSVSIPALPQRASSSSKSHCRSEGQVSPSGAFRFARAM